MATAERSRYLQYLPAIFEERREDAHTLDLGQFLLPFEAVFDEFDAVLAAIDRYFAPELAPANDFLPWLASWVALTLDEEWEEDKRRRLISEAVELYRWRGTARGIKRYLALYTGWEESAFEIQEACWPGGMQIGVASRIGGVVIPKDKARTDAGTAAITATNHDYYVVNTLAPTAFPDDRQPPVAAGQPLQLVYRADCDGTAGSVDRVQIEESGVRMTYRPANGAETLTLFHAHPDAAGPTMTPNLSRRLGLTDYAYTRIAERTAATQTGDLQHHAVHYRGGTFLIEQTAAPYRFIVQIHEPAHAARDPESERQKRWAKVQTILNLEKPAHTEYYLKITSGVAKKALLFMQIGVRSSIGLNTTVA